jgi:uncharacterized protein YndB with AHSA1/START domain
MATAFSVHSTIDRPADEVWAALTRWAEAPTWMSGIDSMAADGPTEVGTKLTFHARGKERPSEIVAVDEGRSVVLRSVQGGVSADYTYSVEPVDEQTTRVSLVAECTTTGAWTLVGPLMRYGVRRTDGGQTDALERWIEGG